MPKNSRSAFPLDVFLGLGSGGVEDSRLPLVRDFVRRCKVTKLFSLLQYREIMIFSLRVHPVRHLPPRRLADGGPPAGIWGPAGRHMGARVKNQRNLLG